MTKFLIIQTAFIGDVILATGILEKLHQKEPESQIDVVVRKGNEGLFQGHPFINKILIWDKKQRKYPNLLKLIKRIRKEQYNYAICLQRFGAAGYMTIRSGAEVKIGFDKNPFSLFFTKKVKHHIGDGRHEIERNHELISGITQGKPARPQLYPTKDHYKKVMPYQDQTYYVIAPASVWFTKQFPVSKWCELINTLEKNRIYIIGSAGDRQMAEEIIKQSSRQDTQNLCGKLNLLESAALIGSAKNTFSCDSAPLHLASAMNAPVSAIYCSTVPAFGFGPLSDHSNIIETREKLDCKPCGLHGYRSCPKGHFKCATTIDISKSL